ncbi:MAG: hypothetical protein ACLQUZ_10040 [Rhizomicrobium sp.]
MTIRLRIVKDNKAILEGHYEVAGAESFGQACADMFSQLRSKELVETTSVGAMMDRLDLGVLDILDGATLSITKV